ncbi:MAG TPA: hypothetical protein VKA14_02200 [Gammaproteobacteria bacterium]|nr:hypothetical protein [Gammaproteobacteria bacterium]
MSRHTVVLGVAATVLTVAASTWASIAIPTRDHAAARRQVTAVLAAFTPTGTAAGPCPAAGRIPDSPYVGGTRVNSRTCTVTLRLKHKAPVQRALRGAELTLRFGRGPGGGHPGWRCTARDGAGASQADFPARCSYRAPRPLL